MKLKQLALVLAASALTCGSASAVPVDAWRLNLSLINGLALGGGPVIAGAVDATNVDHLVISGNSTVEQTVIGGVALGNPFSDTGALQFLANDRESPFATINLNFGTAGGVDVFGYLRFDNLTGILNLDGTITFDTGGAQLGTVAFYLEDDGDLDPTTGNVTKLVDYILLAPSGGSNLDFFGGTAANATVDVTLQATATLAGFEGLFSDAANNPLTLIRLHLVNVDSLLDPNFVPNPNNSGVDGLGNGTSIIRVQNAGQYNLSRVPEPGTMLLLGIGLAGLGFGALRRKVAA